MYLAAQVPQLIIMAKKKSTSSSTSTSGPSKLPSTKQIKGVTAVLGTKGDKYVYRNPATNEVLMETDRLTRRGKTSKNRGAMPTGKKKGGYVKKKAAPAKKKK